MSQKTRVVAAAVQLSPVLYSREQTTEKVCAAIREAGEKGAELVVFPETVIPYYPYFSFIRPPVQLGKEHIQLHQESVEVPSATTDSLSRAAKQAGTVVVIGINERDHGTLYNAQLVFDADGELVLHRRKITPTFHERMVWGQGDGSGLRAVDTRVGRIGALACWEHYNPLARYAMMVDHEEIHAAMFPGSLVGQVFADQIEVTIRHHALESGCFVVNSTAYLHPEQVQQVAADSGLDNALTGGCFTAIVSPEGKHLTRPLTEGEGLILSELDMSLIIKRKRMMDSVGHYSRPELLSLNIDRRPQPHFAGPSSKTSFREPAVSPESSHDSTFSPTRPATIQSKPDAVV